MGVFFLTRQGCPKNGIQEYCMERECVLIQKLAGANAAADAQLRSGR